MISTTEKSQTSDPASWDVDSRPKSFHLDSLIAATNHGNRSSPSVSSDKIWFSIDHGAFAKAQARQVNTSLSESKQSCLNREASIPPEHIQSVPNASPISTRQRRHQANLFNVPGRPLEQLSCTRLIMPLTALNIEW